MFLMAKKAARKKESLIKAYKAQWKKNKEEIIK